MNFSPLRTAALAAALLCSPVILSAQEATPEDDPVVATVNGKSIHRSKVMQAALSLPPQAQAQLDQIFPILVERMVDFELLTDAATEAGMATDEEVLRRIAELTEGVMREVYLTREVTAGVTEAALRERYDAMVATIPAGEEVNARHILLENEDDARAVVAALDEGGDFAELAGEKSIGPTSARGGDLGYFSRDQMVPEFSEAAFALETGAYTKDPVQTQFGWHVILLEDRRDQAPPSFEASEAKLREEVERSVVEGLITGLRDGATIELFPEAIAGSTAGASGEAPAQEAPAQ
jgi:peptidyl-prolyl cis-trans isomerase C